MFFQMTIVIVGRDIANSYRVGAGNGECICLPHPGYVFSGRGYSLRYNTKREEEGPTANLECFCIGKSWLSSRGLQK